MNIRDVEIFHAVMINGSASGAAELLGTSQPSVSRGIASLEKSAGFALFERVKGRLVPTSEGRLFHQEVVRSFVGLDGLRQAAIRIREIGSGSLRIASLAALGMGIVPRAVGAFLMRNPSVHVSLQVRTSSLVRDLVLTGQVDIGLAADEIDLTGIHSSVFATPRAVCVVPKGHRLETRKAIELGDLHQERFIALSPEDTVRQSLDRMLLAAEVEPRIVGDTPFSATVVALVAEGAGIGIANPFALDAAAASRVAVLPFRPQLNFRALLLHSAEASPARLARELIGDLYEARNSFRVPRSA